MTHKKHNLRRLAFSSLRIIPVLRWRLRRLSTAAEVGVVAADTVVAAEAAQVEVPAVVERAAVGMAGVRAAEPVEGKAAARAVEVDAPARRAADIMTI